MSNIMKNILCFIDNLNSGGAQTQLIILASELKRKGYDVFLAYYEDDTFNKDKILSNNISLIKISFDGSILNKILSLNNIIKLYKIDVLIAYLDVQSTIGSLLRLVNRKVKIIVSERNTTQGLNYKELFKFFSFSLADYVVCNSYSQTLFCESNFPFLKKKIRTITNCVEVEKFLSNLDYQSNEKNIYNIAIVGRITSSKNVLGMIEALNILLQKKYKFRVSWYGKIMNESYYDQCIKLVNRYNLADYFVFEGEVINIEKVYHQCDIFCLPSFYEGYPNVICEAMTSGKPILCSNVCDNPQIVTESINGFLFDPHSIESIVNAFEIVAKYSSEELQEIGRMNRTKSLSLFSKEKFINEYLKLIE